MTVVMIIICVVAALLTVAMWVITDRAIRKVTRKLAELDDYNIDLISRLVNARAIVLRSVMQHLDECPAAANRAAKCDCGTNDYNTILCEILINLELDEVVVSPEKPNDTQQVDKNKLN